MSILETIVAGVAGTALMTLLMMVITHVGWARADMIRALGSLVTKSYERSLAPGLLIHFASGIIFAFPYVLVLGGIDLPSAGAVIGVGALVGFVHGFVMSFLLIAAVAEKHPLQQFQDAGFGVAAAHVLGHVGYGVGVAAAAAGMAIDFGFRF